MGSFKKRKRKERKTIKTTFFGSNRMTLLGRPFSNAYMQAKGKPFLEKTKVPKKGN